MAKNTGDPRGPGMPGSGGWLDVGVKAEEVTLRAPQPDAVFEWDGIPPVGKYVLADDVLQVNLLSNQGGNLVVLNYRILTRDSGVVLGQETFAPVSNRASTLFSRQLREGFLLSVALVMTSGLGNSQYTYASVALRRQSQSLLNVMDVLISGYVSQAFPMCWPQSVPQRPTDGAGTLRSILGSVPAAGADISESVPAGARWQLLSLFAQLTTAVAVANRQVNLTLDDGVNIFYETPNGPVQAASLIWEYNFAPLGFAAAVVLTDVAMHYDNAQIIAPGFRIRTDTVSIQAADQWTAPQYLVREWQADA